MKHLSMSALSAALLFTFLSSACEPLIDYTPESEGEVCTLGIFAHEEHPCLVRYGGTADKDHGWDNDDGVQCFETREEMLKACEKLRAPPPPCIQRTLELKFELTVQGKQE